MQAVRFHFSVGPEVLVWEKVPRPAVGRSEELVRVYALGGNPIPTCIFPSQIVLPVGN